MLLLIELSGSLLLAAMFAKGITEKDASSEVVAQAEKQWGYSRRKILEQGGMPEVLMM
jgi:hypothetical protein